jgi:hypothetical protein
MAAFYESMTLPMLFGVVAAIGIAFGLVLLVFARPMRRLEEHRDDATIGGSPTAELPT